LFDNPPIGIHHQFRRCALRKDRFPPNVRFVEHPYRVRWGDIFQVHGEIKALRLLYEGGGGPDWFYILSNSCYPIKTAGQMLTTLSASAADAFIRYRPVGPEYRDTLLDRGYYHRYYRQWYLPPVIVRRLQFLLRIPKWGWLFRRESIYDSEFRCYAGSEFFAGTGDVARYLLQQYDNHPRLLKHYARTYIPSESYYATVLVNSGLFRIRNENLWFIQWGSDPLSAKTPRVLNEGHFERLIASPCHFARKVFSERSGHLLDMLDEHLAFVHK
jgi:hypothetical protein